ncbi:copper resistance protein CopD [Helicobacter pylori]|uniref:CopD family copper resistance protein n=1 Tax=Helicobacter pylori TaxID=210 RepID=UPI0013F4959A|nr:CopD family copper resistance protein [Helicobacter pylori]NHB36113.1 copper resistance protein CopD [Helicobacter pylori]
MDAIYPYVLVVHLLCAIIFIGYLFFDGVIFPNVKKMFGEEFANKANIGITQRAIKIMPLCVLGLVLTGGMMLSQYMGGDKGWCETPFQKILMLKVILALSIFLLVLFSLSCKFLGKKNPIGKYIHHIALAFGFLIAILAKTMWFV